MKKIINIILDFVSKLSPNIVYERCYVKMRSDGNAENGSCHGIVNEENGKLSYNCVNCPYLCVFSLNKYKKQNCELYDSGNCFECFGAANNDCKNCSKWIFK